MQMNRMSVRISDRVVMKYVRSDGKLDHLKFVTIKFVEHYRDDLFSVEFEELDGKFVLELKVIESMKQDYLKMIV